CNTCSGERARTTSFSPPPPRYSASNSASDATSQATRIFMTSAVLDLGRTATAPVAKAGSPERGPGPRVERSPAALRWALAPTTARGDVGRDGSLVRVKKDESEVKGYEDDRGAARRAAAPGRSCGFRGSIFHPEIIQRPLRFGLEGRLRVLRRV